MSSQRITFLLCLIVSAAVHATLLVTLSRYVSRQARTRPAAATPIAYHVAIPEPPPPPPPDLFGQKNAQGDAINASPGDEAQASPLSRPDQAALTRDPTGQGPAARPQHTPTSADPLPPLTRPVTAPSPAVVPTPPPSPAPAFRKPNKPAPIAPEVMQKEQAPPTPEPSQSNTQTLVPPPPAPAPPVTHLPPTPPAPQAVATPPSPAGGRPLPHSDRDSDPFAKQVSVEFKRGRVVARSGREIKLARPRENLASMVEAAEIAVPIRLRLKVAVRADGTVRAAKVTQSSGSPSIDRAFELATYDSWFEPAKDPQGQPVADEVELNIVLE